MLRLCSTPHQFLTLILAHLLENHPCVRRSKSAAPPQPRAVQIGGVYPQAGEVGNFLAYGWAPASLVSPLGAVSVVSNCVLVK